MRLAVQQVAVNHEENKPLFASLFCGGAKECESLKSAGLSALCLSWEQHDERPQLMKIISVLDSLILKSDTLTNAVVICSELVTNQQPISMKQRAQFGSVKIMVIL